MAEWLDWARGPGFRFSILVMILGLLRLAVINTLNIVNIVSHARDKNIPWKTVLRETAKWVFPTTKIHKQTIFAISSIVFHLSVIITPIFLAAHISLWRRGIGLGWPSIPQTVADYLTLIALASAAVLLYKRVSARASRALSRASDYVIPLLIMIPFASGYLAMHPSINPFSYDATMLVHVLAGNVVLVLLPFSKLSHAVLFPTTQLVSEMAWHLVPNSGENVAMILGKENEPI